MKGKFIIIFIFLTFFFALSYLQTTQGENIESGSFEIIDFNINRFGNNSTDSADYTTLLTSDEILDSVRFGSGSYRVGFGVTNTWKASVPEILCFETISNGSTNCTDLDVGGGMVQVCGEGGCFNRARFEIDPKGNPVDTLYSVQITTDPSWNSYQIVDGSTFIPKGPSLRNINDYLSKNTWESTSSNTNILGLVPGRTYYIRLTALKGDFTETEPSPSSSTTTGVPLVNFDIDIAETSGFSAETSPPHSINIGSLNFANVSTASNLIWLDIGTNAPLGVTVAVQGLNGGLFSTLSSFLISTGNLNLDSSPGFGVNVNTATQIYLGPLGVASNYNNGGNIVGEVTTTPNTVFNSSSEPIFGGRASLFLKAKPPQNSPSQNDYSEIITFQVIPSF